MFRRYIHIFKSHIFILAVLIALVIISYITIGRTSVVTSITAGIVMIYIGVVVAIWIIRTPSKKNKDEIS